LRRQIENVIRRIVLVAAVVLGLTPIVRAQTTVAARSLRGIVVDADTGAPLRRARVALVAPSDAPPVFTDNQGQFAIEVPSSANVTLRITKAGYAVALSPITAGRTAAGTPAGTTQPSELRVALTRGVVISGRVLDRYGRPTTDTFVAAVMAAAPGDAPSSSSRRFFVQTDGLGDYRLSGLPAGRFEVHAARRRDGRDPPNMSREEMVFGTGGFVDVGDEKVAVAVKAGDELHDIDFRTPGQAAECGDRESQRPAPGVVRGIIRGQVTDASGVPLPCARVTINSPDASVPWSESDEQGFYTVYGLPAGTFSLTAEVYGYRSLSYGQARSTDPEVTVTLRAGEERERIDFSLPRLGIITGTVVDEQGEPLEGIRMASIRLLRVAGRYMQRPEFAGDPTTDDRGRYRLTDLMPGQYLVSARAAGEVSASTGYSPIYYPNTPDAGAAVRLTVDAGREINDINLNFALTPTFTVAGRVLEPRGPVAATVTMAVSARSGAVALTSRTVDTAADGTFAMRNVPPGEYVFQAQAPGTRNGSGPFGVAWVRVGTTDPDPVTLMMVERSTVEGRIVVEGATDLESMNLSLRALPDDPDTEPIGQIGQRNGVQAQGLQKPNRALVRTLSGDRVVETAPSILRDERFRFSGLSGRNRFTIFLSACATCYIKSASVNGADATDLPFDVGVAGHSFTGAEIVVSDRGGVVSGRALDGSDAPLNNFRVLLFSTVRERWYYSSPYVRTARSSADGAFRITGVPPGDYLVALVSPSDAAQLDGDPLDLSAPSVLDSLTPAAQRLTIREGGRPSMTLRRARP
jgi:protocatechuate 3,4-dioxygenase beta subunit